LQQWIDFSSTKKKKQDSSFFYCIFIVRYRTISVMPKSKNSLDRHKQKTVSFRLPEPLTAQLRLLAGRNRRTLSGEAQIALEQHLAAQGLWCLDGQAPLKPKPAE